MERLPAELLYEIHLFARSDALPYTNSRIHAVFNGATISHRVAYLVGRYENKYDNDKLRRNHAASARGPIAHALLFPLCTEPVLVAFFRYYVTLYHPSRIDSWAKETPLPRRIFTAENMPVKPDGAHYLFSNAPLPLLRRLYDLFSNHGLDTRPDANVHGGYALTRAVFVGHIPLVLFLLSVGARPGQNDALAVRVAIRKRDLQLVRLLVEGGSTEEYAVDKRSGVLKMKPSAAGKKRRRISDRVDVNAAMLKEAVEVDARDVVEYLLDKGARPDMQVMLQMRKSGLM